MWWWWSDQTWWAGALAMALLMALCVVGMSWMMRGMRGMGGMRGMSGMCGFGARREHDVETSNAERILDERLARGEIDVAEHDRLRNVIVGVTSQAKGTLDQDSP